MSNTLRSRIIATIELVGNTTTSSLELDSHADSPVIGSEALIIRTYDRKVKVNGFTPALGLKMVDMVDAEIAYECEFTGKVLIMIIRNRLYLKKMKHNIVSPFIMRITELEINKRPKFMIRHPTNKHHSIYFADINIRLPLAIKSIVSFLATRKPTHKEYLGIEIRLELTPPFSEWDTQSCIRYQ